MQFKGNRPRQMTEGAAGMDLVCAEDTLIPAGEVVLVKTGTAVAIPKGFMGMIAPRSSIANKKDLMLSNSIGVIDSDFRGEMMFPYRNVGSENQILLGGERIGQLIILPYIMPPLLEVDELPETDRGEGGFGSTGSGVEDNH